jgi:uncharacterized protein YbjT (DUF2867 family)
MILVAGATGNVGAELVRALAGAGEPVRALSRNPDPATAPAGVQAVSGDLNRPESLRDALTGVRAVYLLSGYQDMPGLLAEIARAGAGHVVLQSGSSAVSEDTSNAISRYMISSETAVRASGLAWTILRPHSFMSNMLQWAPQLRAGNVVRGPFPEVAVTAIDPYDIAAVAARVLLARQPSEHDGQIYRLTGPEPLRPADRVRILGTVLGRDLRFEGQPDAEARAEMSAAMPPEYVEAFFTFFSDGKLDESVVYPAVREVTGRPPRTLGQWARDHAAAFR